MTFKQINIMNNFNANYDKILNVLLTVNNNSNYLTQRRPPKLSDIELVAMNLTAEYMGIDSECQLFRTIDKLEISDKIERSVYNRRKRKLSPFVEELRQKLSSKFNEFENYFIVDSMPLEVCRLSKSSRVKICKESFHSSPDKGFCASQQMYFYGYKLHAVCSIDGVFQSLDISKASVHDVHYLKDLKSKLTDCVLLGDRGYLSKVQQLDLFETAKITLETPMRRNQIGYVKQPYIYRKFRKRIETLFSQLCDQFRIRNNYAKTFEGFKTRILSKITALTTIQYINKFEFNRNINNLKVLIN